MYYLDNAVLLLALFPIMGIFSILMLPREYSSFMAMLYSVLALGVSLTLWALFDRSSTEYQFGYDLELFSNYWISFGVDGISLIFINLTTFLIFICVVLSSGNIKTKEKEYFALFLLLELFIIFVFISLDLIVFYVFFESVLIPMYFIVGIWGSRERKVHAAYMLFMYTLVGSLLMLVSICVIYISVGTLSLDALNLFSFREEIQLFLWLTFFLSFMVKIPMLPFHIWLPEAHVEAPTTGSVILAGILLKLGGYGFIRLSLGMFPYASNFFIPVSMTLALIGIVYTSLTAIRQTDIKKLIAYTSIAHMNVVMLGIFSLSYNGIQGSIMLMLSHGIISSALFLLIGVIYDRHHTRLLKYLISVGQGMPIFSGVFLFFSFCNFSLPGTSSFIGEFLILLSVFEQNSACAVLGSLGMILGGVYSIWLANRINGGPIVTQYYDNTIDLTRKEVYIFLPLIFLALFMGIYPSAFLDTTALNVQNLVEILNVKN